MSYERFLAAAQSLRAAELPELAAQWNRINPNFRRMLAKRAGLADEQADALVSDLPVDQLAALYVASGRLLDLATQADTLLRKAMRLRGAAGLNRAPTECRTVPAGDARAPAAEAFA